MPLYLKTFYLLISSGVLSGGSGLATRQVNQMKMPIMIAITTQREMMKILLFVIVHLCIAAFESEGESSFFYHH